jgi:hypothetical protein
LWAAVLPVGVEHKHHSPHAESHEVEHGHDDSESITLERVAAHEKLARDIMKSGIDCVAVTLGSHQLEREETYYSHGFALSSRLVTNKGLIEIRGKNIDFVQILQRN